MKADIVLVKFGDDGAILDVIIIENKLSTGTPPTTNQGIGWAKVKADGSLMVKANSFQVIGSPNAGQLKPGTVLNLNNGSYKSVVKYNNHGDPAAAIEVGYMPQAQ